LNIWTRSARTFLNMQASRRTKQTVPGSLRRVGGLQTLQNWIRWTITSGPHTGKVPQTPAKA